MKKVLLALSSETADRRMIDYAVGLCLRIKARLNILQVFDPQVLKKTPEKVRARVERLQRVIDAEMTAITFAEAGEPAPTDSFSQETVHDEALIGEFDVRSGAPDKEIISHVEARHDIVMTLYDPSLEGNRKQHFSSLLSENLGVPVVRIKS